MATTERFEQRKRIPAQAAAQPVPDGLRGGPGPGPTVRPLLPAIAERGLRGLRCVATSPATADQGRALGLPVEEFDSPDALDALDLAIDGADQVSPQWWAVKGGGGAHTREKVVAAAAHRFVIASGEEELVDAI